MSVLHQILGSFSAKMNQRESEKCELTLFKGSRQEFGVRCFCPQFHIDDNWGGFLECLGSNYNQIYFHGVQIPSH